MPAPLRSTLLTWRWLLLTGLVLAAVVAMVLLGVWQWERSAPPDVADRAAVEARAADLAALPAVTDVVDTTGVSGGLEAEDIGRLVRVEGRWRGDLTLLVADRERPTGGPGGARAMGDSGELGRWVVTPVELEAGSPGELLVPVVRGWLPGTDPVEVTDPLRDRVALAGWLQPSEGLDLPADPVQPDGVVPLLSSADLVNRWPGELVRNYVIAAGPPEAAGSPVVPLGAPLEDASAEPRDWRNVAYSLQWYVFAAFALVLWWRMLRDDVRRRAGDPGADPDAGAGPDDGGDGPDDGGDGPGGGGAGPSSRAPGGDGRRDGVGQDGDRPLTSSPELVPVPAGSRGGPRT